MSDMKWQKAEDVNLSTGKEYLIKSGNGNTYLCCWDATHKELRDLYAFAFFLDVTHICEITEPEE